MKTVVPELIGKVRGAQRNVRYIPTNEGRDLIEAGKAISQLGRSVAGAAEDIAKLKYRDHREAENERLRAEALAQQEERANYNRNWLNADAELKRRLAEEAPQTQGLGAVGYARKVQRIYKEVGEKYGTGLSGRNRDDFNARWGNLSAGAYYTATSHESRELTRANADAEGEILKSARDRAASSMDLEIMSSAFADMEDSYNRLQRTLNGGRLITPASLEAFDKDVNDGDKVLTVGGKKLQIVDNDSEAGPGKITRTRIKELRAVMESQAQAYKKGLDDEYDKAHAMIIDGLLKDGRVDEARGHLRALEADVFPFTKRTFDKLNTAVKRHEKVIEMRNTADRVVAEAVEVGKQSLYGSPEQDAEFARKVQAIKDPDTRRHAYQVYQGKKREQSARLMADAHQFIKDNLQGKDPSGKAVQLPMDKQWEVIEKMEDSPLKVYMVKSYKAQMRALEAERNNDPAFRMESAAKLSRFSEDIAAGYYVDEKGNKVTLDVRDSNGQKNIGLRIRELGLSRADRQKAISLAGDSANSVTVEEVKKQFTSVIGRDPTTEDLKTWIPFLWRALEERRGTTPLGSKSDRNLWIKQNFAEVCALSITKKGWFWDSSYTIEEAATNNENALDDGYYFTRGQLDAFIRQYSPSSPYWKQSGVDGIDSYWRREYGSSPDGGTGFYLWTTNRGKDK